MSDEVEMTATGGAMKGRGGSKMKWWIGTTMAMGMLAIATTFYSLPDRRRGSPTDAQSVQLFGSSGGTRYRRGPTESTEQRKLGKMRETNRKLLTEKCPHAAGGDAPSGGDGTAGVDMGCGFGVPPLTVDEIQAELPAFVEVQNRHPKGMLNQGGSMLPHQLALFCLVRRLKPKHIIESGAHEGLGTWLLRQAAPDAQITVVSPNQPRSYIDQKPDSAVTTDRLASASA
ncbi:hypothetical protein T484DRAFT_1769862 [Baffinella frigidus]|nr:hypothetical protein T484DRAFT_1769862 [Cryptophyta sp. CCMP2293]